MSIGEVINDVTWLYDVIPETSQSSMSSHSETRTRINYPCGPFKHTLPYNTVLKSSHSAQNSGRRSITLPNRARANSATGLSVCLWRITCIRCVGARLKHRDAYSVYHSECDSTPSLANLFTERTHFYRP